ncbi:MAG TPA: DUF3857 domain-containing protein [Puia sp.]|nr:DUF3857 domain-containing protein [Puia sp.]
MHIYKKLLSFLLLLSGVLSGSSQTPAIYKEEWSSHPTLHKMTDQENKQSAVVISDIRRVEFIDEGKEVAEYRTLHKIIHLNDNTGIEAFNKVYLGVADNNDIVDIRARTILPDGKVINIDKQNIKDLKEEDGNEYKIFAMEGLVIGSEVEYTYTYKRSPSWFGAQYMQSKFPVREALLEILAPKRLVFQAKGYNCRLASTDTVLGEKKIIDGKLKDIPAAEDEKYAVYKANLQTIEYRLSYNTESGNGQDRLFTWQEMAKKVYEFYCTFSDKEIEKTKDLVEANKWGKLGSIAEKIATVENFVKKQFATRKDIDAENAGSLEWIIKNKLASPRGIVRLYGAIFNQLGIPYQIVMTCSREDARIDRSFENWNNASDPAIYFPDTKKFMAPSELYTRYPFIDPYWGGQEALFCRPVTIGTFTTAIAEIRQLPLEDFSESFNRIESSLHLTPGLDTVVVDMKQSYGGYSAAYYRASISLGDAEQQRQVLKSIVRFGTNSENIVSSKIDNADFESYSKNAPFTVNATVKASEMVENAGNKILLKIGVIIGPQVEMYQEKARQFPIQIAYPHSLERFITLQLPDGYTAKNLDDLTFHNEYQDQAGVTMGFTSDYKVEGNTIKVHIMEQYRRTFFPLSDYENFRKVINSSADFNKVVLVLEKKG